MFDLPMLGTSEQTENSEFQVTLVETNKNIKPWDYPRVNRFFDDIADRNAFLRMLESSINNSGGKLVRNIKLAHPLFETFNVSYKGSDTRYELTIYH